MRSKPPSCSVVTANGPSVVTSEPFTRTVVAALTGWSASRRRSGHFIGLLREGEVLAHEGIHLGFDIAEVSRRCRSGTGPSSRLPPASVGPACTDCRTGSAPGSTELKKSRDELRGGSNSDVAASWWTPFKSEYGHATSPQVAPASGRDPQAGCVAGGDEDLQPVPGWRFSPISPHLLPRRDRAGCNAAAHGALLAPGPEDWRACSPRPVGWTRAHDSDRGET